MRMFLHLGVSTGDGVVHYALLISKVLINLNLSTKVIIEVVRKSSGRG